MRDTAAMRLKGWRVSTSAGSQVSRRKVLAGGWLAGAAALIGLPATRPDSANASSQEEPLVGAWRLGVTLAGFPRRATVLLTFAPGGVMLHDGAQFPSGTGHGAWVKRAEGEYDYTWLSMAFDPEGNYTGMQRTRANTRVDETAQRLEGTGTLTRYDLNEEVVRIFELSFEGR